MEENWERVPIQMVPTQETVNHDWMTTCLQLVIIELLAGEFEDIWMPDCPQFSQGVLGQREKVSFIAHARVEDEHGHGGAVFLSRKLVTCAKHITTCLLTLAVPSCKVHNDLPLYEVTFSPKEKGKLSPDFWTMVDTAADPSDLR